MMLVGTGHWSNPGIDYHSAHYDDMLSPQRQAEIASTLEQLAGFAPTKVALEVMPYAADALNQAYRDYRARGVRAGNLTLSANERHQIGFRLSARAGHERVFGIDWHDPARDIGWDGAIQAAIRLGQDDLVTAFNARPEGDGDRRSSEQDSPRYRTVGQLLLDANDPATLATDHQAYMALGRVGQGDDYIGAEVVLRWYERNVKFFVNLCRIIMAPDDRVLVLIGAGHLPLLRHFLEGAGAYRLDNVCDFLVPG